MSCEEIKKCVKDKIFIDLGGGFCTVQYAGIQSRMSIAINILRSHLKNHNCQDLELENIFMIQGDAQNLPLRSNSVDVVLMAHTLEHVSDYEAAMGEIKRILKQCGDLILVLPNETSINGYNYLNPKEIFRILLKKKRNFNDIKPFAIGGNDGPTYHGHLHIFDNIVLAKYLERTGFDIINTKQGFSFVE